MSPSSRTAPEQCHDKAQRVTGVVLSIGSNVGDSLGHLRSVAAALGPRMVAASAVYSSAPWGGVEQQDFLNAVIIAEDPHTDPRQWLAFARECESAADRVRVQRWGPRSLDVDLVVCRDSDGGDIVGDDPELLLPHPRAHRRAFVLMPWLAVEPDAELTVAGARRPVGEWLAGLGEEERSGVSATEMRLEADR